jgi:hypothetical protein
MEASNQLHALAASPPQKEPLVPIVSDVLAVRKITCLSTMNITHSHEMCNMSVSLNFGSQNHVQYLKIDHDCHLTNLSEDLAASIWQLVSQHR